MTNMTCITFTQFPKKEVCHSIKEHLNNNINEDDININGDLLTFKYMIKNTIKETVINQILGKKIGGEGIYKNHILNYPIKIERGYKDIINNNNDFINYIDNEILGKHKSFNWKEMFEYFKNKKIKKIECNDNAHIKDLVVKSNNENITLKNRIDELERENALLKITKYNNSSKNERITNELNNKIKEKDERVLKLETMYFKSQEIHHKTEENYLKQIEELRKEVDILRIR